MTFPLIRAAIAALAFAGPAAAQTSILPPAATPELATDVSVTWEVRSRFRLFREERDFNRHLAVTSGRDVLAAEQTFARETAGRGWARDMVLRLCADGAGRVTDNCVRDGVRENYLNPVDHRVLIRLTGNVPAGSSCAWTLTHEDTQPGHVTVDCREEVNTRVLYGKPTVAAVEITPPGGVPRRASAEILVQDLLIAGIGDSIAAGEGNPDRPVALSDDGFCFRNFIATGRSEYFRPGRVGYKGDKACETGAGGGGSNMAEWSRLSARWLSAACHRSLYGYQLRAALALAVENPQIAITFVPLACTGATIDVGLFGGQRARELTCGADGSTTCPSSMPAQITELRELLARAKRAQPNRALDLVFLTIGANDINFSGLVADVIIEASAERAIFYRGGVMTTVEDAQSVLERKLPGDFAKLRAALKPLVGGNLSRVVYTTYGHPGLSPDGGPCPGSRDGFDVHPAFSLGGERLRKVALFVQNRFLPAMKALATCTGGVVCAAPASDRMSFADSHQAAFADHGLCARADSDPEFDRACFSPKGESFEASSIEGATEPLKCGRPTEEFRAYASRARWIRTANDSYFAAMTFPEGVSSAMQPSDLHDATWGILSAVYGGAVHPTAEGHAAMADAALAEARSVLRLARPGNRGTVTVQPLGEPGR
jgi:hypothetical protein